MIKKQLNKNNVCPTRFHSLQLHSNDPPQNYATVADSSVSEQKSLQNKHHNFIWTAKLRYSLQISKQSLIFFDFKQSKREYTIIFMQILSKALTLLLSHML